MPKLQTWTFSRQSPTPPDRRRLWHGSKLYSSNWGGSCGGKDVRYARLVQSSRLLQAGWHTRPWRVTAATRNLRSQTLTSTHRLLFGFFIHFLYQPLTSSLQLSIPIIQAVLRALTWEYLENEMKIFYYLILLSMYDKRTMASGPNSLRKCVISSYNYWSVCPVGILVQLAVIVLKYSKNGWICFLRYA